MAVTAFDGQFSFRQDTIARLGSRGDQPRMSQEQWNRFQDSPFMQGVRKTEDLCWKFTTARDEKRAKTDPSFRPRDEDFNAPKNHEYQKAINYYKVLGIDEYATLEEVKKSYKKLSLIYHPDKSTGLSQEQKDEHAAIFIELKNAYLTLSDNPTRRQYDRDRDRDVAGFEVNGFKPKQRPHFDATEVLKKLMEAQKPPGKKIDIKIACKLEKFFYGMHKGIKRTRQVRDHVGFITKDKVFRIDIPRGAAEPHECAFRQGGDHHENTMPDTLNFHLTAKPHAIVLRQGDNLALKSVVNLGVGACREPYIQAEAPSLQGRHLLLWGRNPFYKLKGGNAQLRIKVVGDGMTSTGCFEFTCKLGQPAATSLTTGNSSNGASPPTLSYDGVVVRVKHMSTDGLIWLRVRPSITFGEVREKISQILGLGRGTMVRLLEQKAGGYVPYQDRQPLGGLRQLNCAGTSWSAAPLSQDTAKKLLQDVVDAAEISTFQARLQEVWEANERSPPTARTMLEALWTPLLQILPEYGFEPAAQVMTEKLQAALRSVENLPCHKDFSNRIAQVSSVQKPATAHPAPSAFADVEPVLEQASEKRRPSLKRFLERHTLGPPGGMEVPGSDTEDEASLQSSAQNTENVKHGQGGICSSPAMRRRVQREEKREPVCEMKLVPLGDPVMLFSRPTCSIAFYSNLQHASNSKAGDTQQLPMFGISISSPACAKKKAQREWEQLKSRMLPILRATGFLLLRQARLILPLRLADFSAAISAATSTTTPTLPTEMPWKRIGNDAFKAGDFFIATMCYSQYLQSVPEEENAEETARVLSNRSASLARVGHNSDALVDAQRATQLLPAWARAWARAGFAAINLADWQEAAGFFFKAVQLDPSKEYMEALFDVTQKYRGQDADAAHVEKEKGNVATRDRDHGAAIAHYTVAIALVPRADTESDPHALLNSVLYSNRSGEFCRLKQWTLAVADARQAVAAKVDFVKARNRLGVALLGSGSAEQAYSEFARSLVMDGTDQRAVKGRQACLGILPTWRSAKAKKRLQNRFGFDLLRPQGSSRVFAISDVFFDQKANEEWAHSIDDFRFQEDVLIVAGNVCHTRNALIRALTTFKSKFRRVFYVPGNTELAMHSSEAGKYSDSLAKLYSLYDACDDLGIDMFPAAVSKGVFIVPLLSWYTASFDVRDPYPDANSTTDQNCKWPLDPHAQVWKYMLKLNEAHLRHPYHGTVITFSHFLPRQSLPHEAGKIAKTMGCEELDEQIRAVRSRLHIYGHSKRRNDEMDDGVKYLNRYHGLEDEHEDNCPLLCVFDGKNMVSREVPIE